MVISFIFFLLVFVLVGVASYWKSTANKKDYYLASSDISPAFVGLSAVATNNSGYMFIGVIGYTYVAGLSSVWIMLGWILGDFLSSLFVHKKLREATARTGQVSYASVLSIWNGMRYSGLTALIGIVSLLFLMAYASAQFLAGSKALHVLFGWPLWIGASLSAMLVMVYCVAGGIRASIWTDVAQSIVMILAMLLLLISGVVSLGGMEPTLTAMNNIDGFMDWSPQDLAIPGFTGVLLFIISWLFAGLSVIGQPHIMVRFMALEDSSKMTQARTWYYCWFLAFYVMATAVGMLSRVYLAEAATFDAELALPTMALQLLPPVLTGLVLAGIFAATMSTADSLILSCSAAITNDLFPQKFKKTLHIKMATIVICLMALMLSMLTKSSVFNLVVFSWSGLASAFAPLLIVQCFSLKPRQATAIVALLAGLLVAVTWRLLGWHTFMYEGMPGILTGIMILLLGRYWPHKELE